MSYSVRYADNAKKDLKKLDRHQAGVIVAWIKRNLIGCENPRLHGKALTGDKRGLWRYRIGTYRVIADIQDSIIQIEIINVGHRSNIYR